ncbi:hypothetical protein BOVATA_011390 [Babesia ovata]|uniref:Uncharacterized protein n=1 Tax=Babesia ovata TaxID=189622 RepID=A0A2H6K9H1_9APIC|nr:uncharacterized protein BOVATA_011390 [Babesia ovata]GBE59646.1 hypothetical protein BOVATA_011390 [Babesia ovata]
MEDYFAEFSDVLRSADSLRSLDNTWSGQKAEVTSKLPYPIYKPECNTDEQAGSKAVYGSFEQSDSNPNLEESECEDETGNHVFDPFVTLDAQVDLLNELLGSLGIATTPNVDRTGAKSPHSKEEAFSPAHRIQSVDSEGSVDFFGELGDDATMFQDVDPFKPIDVNDRERNADSSDFSGSTTDLTEAPCQKIAGDTKQWDNASSVDPAKVVSRLSGGGGDANEDKDPQGPLAHANNQQDDPFSDLWLNAGSKIHLKKHESNADDGMHNKITQESDSRDKQFMSSDSFAELERIIFQPSTNRSKNRAKQEDWDRWFDDLTPVSPTGNRSMPEEPGVDVESQDGVVDEFDSLMDESFPAWSRVRETDKSDAVDVTGNENGDAVTGPKASEHTDHEELLIRREIDEWARTGNGELKDIRTLLFTLKQVLWRGITWNAMDITSCVSDKAAIKRHYRRALLACHPDKHNKSDWRTALRAQMITQALQEAWCTLT